MARLTQAKTLLCFNLLFEAIFYATLFLSYSYSLDWFIISIFFLKLFSMRHNKTYYVNFTVYTNFNLLFEAIFYATQYKFSSISLIHITISIFFLKLFSMRHKNLHTSLYRRICISIFFLKLFSMRLIKYYNNTYKGI